MKKNELENKVSILTFGCQMNERDSEVIAGLLSRAGYALTDDPAGADVVILNTCSVRQHAEEKVWSEVGRIARARRETEGGGRRPLIGIVGCMAQNHQQGIFKRAPEVDFVVGPSDIDKIPKIIERLIDDTVIDCRGDRPVAPARKIWETDGTVRPEEVYHTGFHRNKDHAYVVISEGCSNYCSYCVVPFVRGQLRHRPYEEILREVEEVVAAGITSVTLLGQNVNAYAYSNEHPLPGPPPEGEGASGAFLKGEGRGDFVELLRAVNEVEGLREFGFLTSHPRDTTVELFEAMARLEKLTQSLHLPVQSGSDRILGAMNRGYTRKYYLELISNYRKIVKGGRLTTDIILGFPSETEEDFQDTVGLVRRVGFHAAFIFKYSPRPYTAAARLADDVEAKEKQRRHAVILELQKKISRAKRD